jgi:hypothetical protein
MGDSIGVRKRDPTAIHGSNYSVFAFCSLPVVVLETETHNPINLLDLQGSGNIQAGDFLTLFTNGALANN